MKIALRRPSESGVTLVDVVMAIGVLGVMASGIFGCFRYGFFTLQLVRENQRATQILLEKVETIRLYSWDQITTGYVPSTSTFAEKYDPQAPTESQGVTYTGTMLITDAPLSTSYAANMKLVVVTLNWKTGNLNRTRQFKSYVSRYGMQDYIY